MSAPVSLPLPPTLPRRIDLVDAARGVALLAMFVFHFAYDLSLLELIATDIQSHTAWRLFARMIAASFLTLVGISLVLATRDGLNRKAYLKRLAMVGAAATLVTVATFFAIPDNFIFFGILHQVALASVLALPFLRARPALLLGTAMLVFAAPLVIAHPVLDTPALAWLGLSDLPLQSADFVPVFPWFGWVLVGMALGRLSLASPLAARLAQWRGDSLPARGLIWGGRHSLLVYLVHQPVFMGALLLAIQLGLARPDEERPFLTSCQRSCASEALSTATCTALCGCTMAKIKEAGLWRKTVENALTPDDSLRTTEFARACYRQGNPQP